MSLGILLKLIFDAPSAGIAIDDNGVTLKARGLIPWENIVRVDHGPVNMKWTATNDNILDEPFTYRYRMTRAPAFIVMGALIWAIAWAWSRGDILVIRTKCGSSTAVNFLFLKVDAIDVDYIMLNALKSKKPKLLTKLVPTPARC